MKLELLLISGDPSCCMGRAFACMMHADALPHFQMFLASPSTSPSTSLEVIVPYLLGDLLESSTDRVLVTISFLAQVFGRFTFLASRRPPRPLLAPLIAPQHILPAGASRLRLRITSTLAATVFRYRRLSQPATNARRTRKSN